MRILLVLLGAWACVAKDAGARQQALDAKQKNVLRGKHVIRQQQAIDLNAHHQQIQSIDLNQRHDALKADPNQPSERKKCSRNRVVAGVLAIFLLPIGAHRWYYGYFLMAVIYCLFTLAAVVLFCFLRRLRNRLKRKKDAKRRTCYIWLYYICAIKLIALIFIVFGLWLWENFLVWTRIQKPVDLAHSGFFSWKVEDCKFE